MSVKDILFKRHNVFKFSDKSPDESVINEILDISFYSPSFGNLMPWKIYVLGPNKNSNKIKRKLKRFLRFAYHYFFYFLHFFQE